MRSGPDVRWGRAARRIRSQLPSGMKSFYAVRRMVVLGGIVGAIVGFGVGLLLTEVIIGNPPNQSGFDWIMVTDVVFTAIGALGGVGLSRRLVARRVHETTRMSASK